MSANRRTEVTVILCPYCDRLVDLDWDEDHVEECGWDVDHVDDEEG